MHASSIDTMMMMPSSYPAAHSNHHKQSRSIPIAHDAQRLREEYERQEGDMVADFKDYLFCSRLVDGMRKQQRHRQDIDLKYQNQAVIDHIIHTRREVSDSSSAASVMPHPSTLRTPPSSSYYHNSPNVVPAHNAIQQVLDLVEDDDELIFDMEL